MRLRPMRTASLRKKAASSIIKGCRASACWGQVLSTSSSTTPAFVTRWPLCMAYCRQSVMPTTVQTASRRHPTYCRCTSSAGESFLTQPGASISSTTALVDQVTTWHVLPFQGEVVHPGNLIHTHSAFIVWQGRKCAIHQLQLQSAIGRCARTSLHQWAWDGQVCADTNV